MADVVILGDLTLSSSPYGVKINGHDFLEPPPELTMRARAVKHGNVLVKKRYPNVIRTIKVNVSSSDGTKDSLNGNLRAIETELRKLDIGESLTLQYTPNGGTVDNFSDVISGSRETRLDWFYVVRNEAIEATIILECEPFWRGSQITIAQQTFSPTPAVLTASTVQGDIEEGLVVYVERTEVLATGKFLKIKGYGALISQNVIITFFDKDDVELDEITARTTGVGEYEILWQVPSDLPPGTYLIRADDAAPDDAETTFVLE